MRKRLFGILLSTIAAITTPVAARALLPVGFSFVAGASAPSPVYGGAVGGAVGGATTCTYYGPYPFVTNGCLNAGDLNSAIGLSPGFLPPQNSLGQGAQQYKFWLDTSQSPPILRQCVNSNGCGIAFNANDWLSWGTIDTLNRYLNLTLTTLNVSGSSVFTGAITANDALDSTSSTVGAITIPNGGLGVGKSVYIGGGLNVTGISTLTGNFNLSGLFTENSAIDSTSSITGAITIPNGGLGVGKSAFVGNNITVGLQGIFNGTINSTSYSTGTVTIPNGGLGVGKDVYIGGGLTVGGNFTTVQPNEAANCVYAGPASGSPAPAACRSLVQADLPAILPTGASVAAPLSALTAPRIPITSFGASAVGSHDIGSAFNQAVIEAQNGNPNAVVYVPTGRYLIDGTSGTIDLSHVTVVCEGQSADADAALSGSNAGTMGYQGATFLLTSTTVHPFAEGPGVGFIGCNFYYPNQTANPTTIAVAASPFTYTNTSTNAMSVNINGGTISSVTINGITQPFTSGTFNLPASQSIVVTYTVAPTMAFWQPVVYPSLFTEISGSQATNDFYYNDRIINAYDFWDQSSANDAIGALQFVNTYGYAIHDWFYLAYMPETSSMYGMQIDASSAQDIDVSPYYMRNWTANNGSVLEVWGTTASQASGGVDGFNWIGGGTYGYRWFVHIDNLGLMTESNITGTIVDGVGTPLQIDAGGCAGGLMMTGLWYAYIVNPSHGLWNASDTDANPAFSINSNSTQTCTSTDIHIEGSLLQAQGDVLDVTGPLVKNLTLSMPSSDDYGYADITTPIYFADIANSATALNLNIHDTHIQPAASYVGSNRLGISINAGSSIILDNNINKSVYDPIILNGVTAGTVSGSGNLSVSPPVGSVAVSGNDYTDIHKLLQNSGNNFADTPLPTVSACGTSPTIVGDDSSGIITVGTGTVTGCTVGFNPQYTTATSTVCTAMSSIAASLYDSALTTTTVTFSSVGGTNIAGASLYYRCKQI